MKKYIYQIDYKSAIEWCGNKYVPFDNAGEVDRHLWEFGNRKGPWEVDVDGSEPEVFQMMIFDCSDDDVEFLHKRFPDLLFIHGVDIDAWFLCVDHFGTAWDYVNTRLIPDSDGLMLPKEWNNEKAVRHFQRDLNAKFQRYEVKK